MMAKQVVWAPKKFKTLMARGFESDTIIKQLEGAFKGFPIRLTVDDLPKLEAMQAMVMDNNAPNNPYTQLIGAIANYNEILLFISDETAE